MTSNGEVTIAPVIPPILPATECFHPCSFFSDWGGEAVEPGGVFEAEDSAGINDGLLGPGSRGAEVVDGPGSQALENEVEAEVEGAMSM
jgi:hypothetical protein